MDVYEILLYIFLNHFARNMLVLRVLINTRGVRVDGFGK